MKCLDMILLTHKDGSLSCPTGKQLTWWVTTGWYDHAQYEPEDCYLRIAVDLFKAGF